MNSVGSVSTQKLMGDVKVRDIVFSGISIGKAPMLLTFLTNPH